MVNIAAIASGGTKKRFCGPLFCLQRDLISAGCHSALCISLAAMENRRVIKTADSQSQIKVRSLLLSRQNIYITLTNRDFMNYHMLLGREAMRLLIVDPAMSFCQGKLTKKDSLAIYNAVVKPKQKRKNNIDMS